MKILLHSCCAPCAVKCAEVLQKQGEVTLFWYNPNIHPFTEYQQRKATLAEYARNFEWKYVLEGDYALQEFLGEVWQNIDARCNICYRMRLERTAEYASRNGFDAFSTTLLISPYQDHNLIVEIAHTAGEKYGAAFLYYDFRPLFREGNAQARALDLYMQKYCGCIFSEEERYTKKKK